MNSSARTGAPRDHARSDGFSLVELVIAVVILTVGVLGMAGTTAFIVRQTTLADINTERSAALQATIEQLRSTNTNSIATGSAAYGSYSVSWAVSDSSTISKTLRLITTGPGLRRDSAAVTPMLGASVRDTFFMTVLKP